MQLANPADANRTICVALKNKKLLYFYWEVCPKYDDNGKLTQEIILVYVSNLSNYHESLLIAHIVTQYETIL
jgi:hypothetical protein